MKGLRMKTLLEVVEIVLELAALIAFGTFVYIGCDLLAAAVQAGRLAQ